MNNNKYSSPFFSILIPSYNRPEDVSKNVASILANTFDDYEIIISDDNSPKSREVERSLQEFSELPNFQFYQQSQNLREPNNKNFLVSKSSGQYNIIIGDDDRFCKDALTIIKNYIDRYPNYEMYSFGYHIIDENDRTINTIKIPYLLDVSIENKHLIKDFYCADMFPLWLFHPATFCCKKDIESSIQYQTDVGIAEDLYFLFEFLNQGHKMLIIPEAIFYWRKIQNLGVSKQINQSLIPLVNLKARVRIHDKLLKQKFLNRNLSDIISTYSFRYRFIYQPLLSDSKITIDDYSMIGITNNLEDEILELSKRLFTFYPKWQARLLRVYRFCSLFGFKGLSFIIKLLYQRTWYHIFSFPKTYKDISIK